MRLLSTMILLLLAIPGTGFAKCVSPDDRLLLWKGWINEKTLPPGVEIVDRVWIRNPTSTELVIYTPEKGAAKRTGYRKILGDVPTTDDELPGTKLVNGERYEYHFPENPGYPDGTTTAQRSGWLRQDYTAALIEPSRRPEVPPKYEKRLLSGKLTVLEIMVPVLVYFGNKRAEIEYRFEFRKNANFGKTRPECPNEAK